MLVKNTDVLVIGAGSIGIASAYYLKLTAPKLDVTVVDCGQPLAFTSAQSGENYRNWWPHPVMKRFTDRSTELMEEIARKTNNRIILTRRGYVLATRNSSLDGIIDDLTVSYGEAGEEEIRFHRDITGGTYVEPLEADWMLAPSGVDVLENSRFVQNVFPWLDNTVQSVVHIRRAGTFSSQQLGQYMLERFREMGGKRITSTVAEISCETRFRTVLGFGESEIRAERLINAAGPFINDIARMLGTSLPVENVLQQKIAFEDKVKAIPRRMPFTIDLDPQCINWDDAERELLLQDPSLAPFSQQMMGGVHCRPDGGDNGTWIKLGWAFNRTPSPVTFEPILSDSFPEIVLRGASRLNPSLKTYFGHLPRTMTHYGGFYTLTEENWPLIGPMEIENAFVVGAMSGFGSMAACAAGELCAQWVLGTTSTPDAVALSPKRYKDTALMAELRAQTSRGLL